MKKLPLGISLFSGLNNLTDTTLDSEYATICGYTEPEMTTVFAEHLKGKPLEAIRHWYNGYSWLGEKVYNPFSILHYLRTGVFRNYWFESGTPAFLVDLLKAKHFYIPDIENIEASESIIGDFDVDFIEKEKAQLRIYQTLLGNDLEFDRRKRNIVRFDWEPA